MVVASPYAHAYVVHCTFVPPPPHQVVPPHVLYVYEYIRERRGRKLARALVGWLRKEEEEEATIENMVGGRRN